MADSVLQSPTNPHFLQPLLPGFNSHLNIPVAFFSKHLQGRIEHKTAKLRSDASDTVWEVKIDDGGRFTGGWKEFVKAHDFRIGDVIVFRHEGDLVFHVTAFGPSCCEIEYKSSHNINDHQDNNMEIKPKRKRAKKNQRREEDSSSSDNSCFVANVSSSNLYRDRLYVPISFVRSNGLSKTYGKVLLLDEKGRSWKLSLDHDKSGVNTYLKHGWRRFCNANGMNVGRYTFKLVRNSGTPVIRLCKAEYRPDKESRSDHSCLVGTVTASSLTKDTLYLPRDFARSNGLNEGCCEMVLKNENGGKWNLVLRHYKSNNTTVITQGWRSFCRVNGIKAGDHFRFKLVRTGENLVFCLCPPETHTRRHNISVKEENEEESIEDKSILRECLNIKKRKYYSRPGASSSQSQNRFVTLTVTPYSASSNRMGLPVHFRRANGMNKPGKITMLDQNGVNRMVHLSKGDRHGGMRLGKRLERIL